MFCKECGAEIPNDAKFCKECGAKIVNDAPVIQQSETSEKESFFKKNKKMLIGCCAGLLVIFLIFAFVSDDHTTGFREISLGYDGNLTDMGYDGFMKERNNTHAIINYVKDDSRILLEIDEGDTLDEWIYDESQIMTINGIEGYYTPYEDTHTFAYKDNDCTVILTSYSMDDLKLAVHDY